MTDLERIEGLHVGALNGSELWLFEKAVEDGIAYRSYEGAGGFLGMAKVRLRRETRYIAALTECAGQP